MIATITFNMFAFVNGALPLRSYAASIGGRAICRSLRVSHVPVSGARGMTMRKSEAMPFAEAPDSLDPDVVGYRGFDPFGLSTVFDQKLMQEAEIKHCRVCMLAVLGLIVPEFFTFPFYHPPAGALTASKEMHDFFVANGALKQIFLWIGFAEVFGAFALKETLEGDRPAGYFGLDPLNLANTPEKMAKYRLNELKNGRLAMCAVGGIIHQQFITHEPTIYNLTHFHGVPVQF